jgi:hypothetical protein
MAWSPEQIAGRLRFDFPDDETMRWPNTTEPERQADAGLAETIERIRWHLWHGRVRRALDLIGETLVALNTSADDTAPIVAATRKVARLLGALST